MYINKLTLVSVMLLLALSGCGGGGDDKPTTTTTPFTPLNVPAAEATVENATEAVSSIIGGIGTQEFSILAVSDAKPTGLDPLAFATKQLKIIQTVSSEAHALNEVISQSYLCTQGGSISVTGNIDATSTNATMTANSCTESGMTMTGTMNMAMRGVNYGDSVSYMKLSFVTGFRVSGVQSMSIYSGSYIEMSYTIPLDYYTDIGAGTLRSSLWLETLGQNMRYDDLTIAFTQNGYSNGTNCYKSGRIYTQNLTAYLDIDTAYDPNCSDPFVTSSFSVVSGSVRLLGNNGTTVTVRVTSPDTYLAEDENGNTLETVQ